MYPSLSLKSWYMLIFKKNHLFLFFRIIITRVSVDISLARKSIVNKPNRVLGTGTNKMTAVGKSLTN